jgi:type VI secretion system secreted protein VgrG
MPVPLQAVNGRGQASLVVPGLSVGLHNVVASYAGNDPFAPSASEVLTVTVNPPPAPAATTTQLLVAPNPAAPGQPIQLTALVTAADGGIPTGTVTFAIDGVPRPPVPLSTLNAQAQATLTIAELGAGNHTITASFGGGSGFAPSDSGPVVLVVNPPADRDGPLVASFQRFGFHAAPTRLVLTFNEPIDAARAQNISNYRLVDPRGRPIRINAAVYDPVTRTVSLHPSRRLPPNLRYVLTINGATPAGLTDTRGNLLDGTGDGQPGGNFVTVVDRHDLVLGGSAPAFSPRFPTSRIPRPTGFWLPTRGRMSWLALWSRLEPSGAGLRMARAGSRPNGSTIAVPTNFSG